MALQRTKDLTIVDSISLTTTQNSPAVDVSSYIKTSIQVVFTYGMADTSAGSIRLQASNDNFNFSDVPDSSLNFTSATTNHIINVVDYSWPYVRVAFINTSGTGGTAKVTLHAVYVD